MRISDWSSDVCSSDLLSGQRYRICLASSHWQYTGQGQDCWGIAGSDYENPAGPTDIALPQRQCAGHKIPAVLYHGRSRETRRISLSSRHDGRSEEHTSELQSLMRISYAVFCLQKKITHN